MINKILDVVIAINRDTQFSADFELCGSRENEEIRITIAKGKNDPNHIDYVYGWRIEDEQNQFGVNDTFKQNEVYGKLLCFYSNNRPREKIVLKRSEFK